MFLVVQLGRLWTFLLYCLSSFGLFDLIWGFPTKKQAETPKASKNNTTNQILSPRNLPISCIKKILVLDLDETLVHSTTKHVPNPDLSIEVAIEGITCVFHILKRPYVDLFIDTVCEWYDVMIFTASLRTYANPVIDKLGKKQRVWRRLFRESCVNTGGSYVKDLSTIHKNLAQIIIIDNSPIAYSLNKERHPYQ